MIKKYKNRLRKLATFLRTVPKKQFNFTRWYEEDKCGTVACSLGWACTIPEFKSKGLKLDSHQVCCYLNPSTNDLETAKANNYVFCPVDINKLYYINAAMAFFGLNRYEANRLFFGEHSNRTIITPKDASNEILDFLKEKENE